MTIFSAPHALRFIQLCIFCVALFVAVAMAHAELSFGVSHGLPSSSINTLSKDSRGVVWVGTQLGAATFDGRRFSPVRLSNGKTEVAIRASAAARSGVWLATEDGLFHAVPGQTPARVLDQRKSINALHVQALGDEIFAATGAELLRFNTHGELSARYRLPLLQAMLTAIDVHEHYAWLATDQGLFRFDYSSATAKESTQNDTAIISPVRFTAPAVQNGARYLSAILEYPKGQLWLGYYNDGLVKLDLKSGAHQRFLPGQANSGALNSTSIYAFAATPERLYIGTNRGLVYFGSACQCLQALDALDWKASDRKGLVVQALLVAPDGLWAGTFGQGLSRFSRLDEAFHVETKITDQPESLKQNSVRTLHLDDEGRLWLGSYGGGLQWIASANRKFGMPWRWNALPMRNQPIEADFTWDLHTRGDTLLVATGNGFYRRNRDTLTALAPGKLSGRCVLTTSTGRTVLGSVQTVFAWTPKGGAKEIAIKPNGSGAVWSCVERAQKIWLAGARGLFRLNADLQQEWSAEFFVPDVGTDTSANDSRNPILAQFLDAEGRLWLGSGLGLLRAEQTNSDTPTFTLVQGQNTKELRGIGSIEQDNEGTLWLGTNSGLVRFDPKSGTHFRYDRFDGLFGQEFAVGASANDGRYLYFGGSGGMVMFDPLVLKRLTNSSPKPSLGRFRVGDGEWRIASELKLAPQHRALELEFYAGDVARPDLLRFEIQYGENTTPRELGAISSAYLERLPSGAGALNLSVYDLRSAARPAAVPVLNWYVRSSWYRTPWGIALLVSGLLAGAVVTIRLRTASLQRQRSELEKEVSARTLALSAAHDEIAASNRLLKEMAIRDPLTKLYNRRHLFDEANLWPRDGRSTSGVLLCDLDYFKAINDQFGHSAGDLVLVQFAEMLQFTLGTRDGLCVRYGGEEFLVVLWRTNTQELAELARNILAATRNIRLTQFTELHVSTSIGGALASLEETLEACVRCSDEALYQAKLSRDTVCIAQNGV